MLEDGGSARRNILAAVGLILLAATIALALLGRRFLVPEILCLVPGLVCFWSARLMGWRWVR